MKKSLTIVLPVYNGESQLRTNVREMLELAAELTDRFKLLIIDDGSVDDTFELANELAAEFPQVSVRRQSTRGGLGPALDSIRGSVKSDVVVVHDGVTPLDANQLRQLWRQETQSPRGSQTMENVANELAGVARVHSSLAKAHRRITGLELMPSLANPVSSDGDESDFVEASNDRAPKYLSAGRVGRIPALPRPNFLEAIADFALGE